MISRAEYNRQKQLHLDEICQAIVELNIQKDGLLTRLEHLDLDFEEAEDNHNAFLMESIQNDINRTIDDVEDLELELLEFREELEAVENESYQDAMADAEFDRSKDVE